jgi:hypothetical protein
LVGLSSALILAGKNRAALDALGFSHHGQRVTEIAKTYGAVSFNRAVALLRCGDEDRAMRELTAAANAEHPASEAAELAGRMMRRRAREASWLGFWFLDRDSGRARQLAGVALLALLTITTVVTIANPAKIGWLGWVSPDGNHRLVPLLAIAALFLLPMVTRLKFGSVEIEQPQPTVAAVPELLPISADDVIEELTAVVHETTRRLARAGAARGGPVGGGTAGLDQILQTATEATAKLGSYWVAGAPAT